MQSHIRIIELLVSLCFRSRAGERSERPARPLSEVRAPDTRLNRLVGARSQKCVLQSDANVGNGTLAAVRSCRPVMSCGVATMGWMPGALAAALLVAYCSADAARAAELPTNDYPTVARADYVFGCMQVNGQTRDALERCSCSIDVIASLLPFDQYEEAETVMRVRQRAGKNASMFLAMPMLRGKVDDLKRAQVEAELRCF